MTKYNSSSHNSHYRCTLKSPAMKWTVATLRSEFLSVHDYLTVGIDHGNIRNRSFLQGTSTQLENAVGIRTEELYQSLDRNDLAPDQKFPGARPRRFHSIDTIGCFLKGHLLFQTCMGSMIGSDTINRAVG